MSTGDVVSTPARVCAVWTRHAEPAHPPRPLARSPPQIVREVWQRSSSQRCLARLLPTWRAIMAPPPISSVTSPLALRYDRACSAIDRDGRICT